MEEMEECENTVSKSSLDEIYDTYYLHTDETTEKGKLVDLLKVLFDKVDMLESEIRFLRGEYS